MSEARAVQLQAVDAAILTDIVRLDQRSPSFVIDGWSVRPLSDRGFTNTDALWLVGGRGRDAAGERPWSVAVKIIGRQEPELPQTHLGYWMREPLLFQSGLAENLPGRVRTPRFYRMEEKPEAAWIWMERVGDTRAGAWTLEDYNFAGRQFGFWNGTAHGQSTPAVPWLARDHGRTWVGIFNPEQDLLFPLNAKYLTGDVRRRYDRFWAELETFFNVFEALPQVVSHRDPQRRNMFIQQGLDGQDELVLVDWALYGWGPVGGEAAMIGPVSGLVMAYPPRDVAEVSEAAYAGYADGLREAGWTGDLEKVRLAYLLGAALWNGGSFAGWLAYWCSPERRAAARQHFELAEEDLYLAWFPLLEHALDCADAARELMKKLGMTG